MFKNGAHEWKRSAKDRQVDFRNEDEFGVFNWTRRALGDKVVYIIYLPEETDPAELARLHVIFPEGRTRLTDWKSHPAPATPSFLIPPDKCRKIDQRTSTPLPYAASGRLFHALAGRIARMEEKSAQPTTVEMTDEERRAED